ncbi:hypothetical protein MAR_006429 [Mya arenaria]|uniref:Uncharacterized protein n=1 Tax=Mya arenaria TaxID=6604 RepID=A0ABY7DCZ8_MYAAR|nr:hypothetical protein MAR_006429 [Mya arenaria]
MFSGLYSYKDKIQRGPSSGPVIGGAVGGSIGGVVAIVLALVVLRRKYTHKCNIKRKTDAPPGKSVGSGF